MPIPVKVVLDFVHRQHLNKVTFWMLDLIPSSVLMTSEGLTDGLDAHLYTSMSSLPQTIGVVRRHFYVEDVQV
jgi:hypothetical protein